MPFNSTLVTASLLIPPILGPVYLGGLPHSFVGQSRAAPFIGFVGCIRELEMNGEDRLVFSDAANGANILDCDVEACTYDPCMNNGTCVMYVLNYNSARSFNA